MFIQLVATVSLAIVAINAASLHRPQPLSSPTIYEPRSIEDDTISFAASPLTQKKMVFHEDAVKNIRVRRSQQPGAQGPTPPPQNNGNVDVDIHKEGPNTNTHIKVDHAVNDRFDVRGTWSKTVDGPGKAKPNWSVGGSYRW